MHSLKTATFNDTSCKSENNLFVLKNFSSKKRCTIFCDNFFLTTRVMKNFFCLFFYSRIFACKKISLKKVFILLGWWIYFSWLKLFFIYRLPHFLSVKWRFPVKNIFQNQKIWKIPIKEIVGFTRTDSSCSKLSCANCSKVSYIYITYLYTTY